MKNLNHCIQTLSGIAFDLVNPQEEDIFLSDIFHSLAGQNRFTGQGRVPYTIAEHSLLVSKLVPDPYLKLAGLCHDFAECYVGDCATPLKSLLPEYKKIENRITELIFKRLGMSMEEYHAIKIWDSLALEIESKALMGPRNKKLWQNYKVRLPKGYDLDFELLTLRCLSAKDAEIALTDEFNKLWLGRFS